jgi:multidrug efflux pump subunit AcrA (membrane-fusion protein)
VTFSQPPAIDSTPAEAWQEIETALDELAALARSDLPAAEFHGRVLARLVGLLAAVGGAMWSLRGERVPNLLCQLHLDQSLAGDAQELARHQRLAAAIAERGEARLVPPAYRDGQLANASPWLAILCPVTVDSKPVLVVEIFQRPDGRAAVEAGYLRIVRTASELIEEYHRRQALGELREQQGEARTLLDYVNQIHARLNLPEVAAAIVNEARRVINCDRVTVLVERRGKARVLGISGVESFDKRSGVVQSLERLSRSVFASGEAVWFPETGEDLPPQVADDVQAYLDESHARSLGLVPIRAAVDAEGPAAGLLAVERFDAEFDDTQRRRSLDVARATAPALVNALDYEEIPLRGLMQWLAAVLGLGRGRRWSPALVVAGVVAAAAIALWLIPADFTIEARGQLMPERRQNVFAPSDGIVVELPGNEGTKVAKGALLARLYSPALDIQQSELVGKQRTVQEDLLAAETEAVRGESERSSRFPRGQVTARVEQLKEELRGIESQLQIVRQEQAKLAVASPLDGTVITWDVERQLAGRPVKRGEWLLTVADLAGPWELSLDVPDYRAGHVLAAAKDRPAVPITFQLGTDPGAVRRGTVKFVSPATELSAEQVPAVRVTANLAEAFPAGQRPGATVVARVHCGRRSLGYVWLHEFWEAVRLRFFW